MQADEIKAFIDGQRRAQRLSQERLSEAAELPDMYQTYQRYLKSKRGGLRITIRLLAALGYTLEIIPVEEKGEGITN